MVCDNDAYSKHTCIYPTFSISIKSTMKLLEQTFVYFGYPHSLVTHKAASFIANEFQYWCKERGIAHLMGETHPLQQMEELRDLFKLSNKHQKSQHYQRKQHYINF